MPKVLLLEAVQVGGKVLVPGEQDLSEAQIDRLIQNGRGHLVLRPGEAIAPPPVLVTGDLLDDDGEPVDLLAAFPALREAGYTVETIRAATDTELLAVKGIGPATLNQIRTALA